MHYGSDSEIWNHEYEQDNCNTSEYEFTSNSADKDEREVEKSIEELVLMLKESEKKTESSDEDQ